MVESQEVSSYPLHDVSLHKTGLALSKAGLTTCCVSVILHSTAASPASDDCEGIRLTALHALIAALQAKQACT